MSGAEGLTNAEALMSATSWAADAMGTGDQLGRIEPGMLADIIIVDGDPLSRIEDILRVEQVISAGRVFDVQDLARKQ
jgi:imidazolonepropionase-like amidohydrolase